MTEPVLITAPPSPPPSRSDPANFAERGDAYHSWLGPAVEQMNDQHELNNTLHEEVITARDDLMAAGLANAEANALTATAQAAAATGSVSLAGAHANAASAATATASAQAASAASAASAANTALLALGNAIANGVGAFSTDADGNLIGSYNTPTVTSMSINASGELLVVYP